MVKEFDPNVLAINPGRDKSNGRSPSRHKKANNTADHEKEHRNRYDPRNVGVLVLRDGERNARGEEKKE